MLPEISIELGKICKQQLMCAVYVGSTFIQEALRKARELTDAAYAWTNERSVTEETVQYKWAWVKVVKHE